MAEDKAHSGLTRNYILENLTAEEMRGELKRRRELRRRMHKNAKIRVEIESLQRQIDALRKQIQ